MLLVAGAHPARNPGQAPRVISPADLTSEGTDACECRGRLGQEVEQLQHVHGVGVNVQLDGCPVRACSVNYPAGVSVVRFVGGCLHQQRWQVAVITVNW